MTLRNPYLKYNKVKLNLLDPRKVCYVIGDPRVQILPLEAVGETHYPQLCVFIYCTCPR
jgi:hypothetical protein